MILRRRPNGQAPASSPARAARCWAATAWARTRFARTLSLLNKLWDGAPHIVDRATAASFAVRGARLTISLQVQPHVLADFLDRDRGMAKGSGFLAKFLVAQPASLQGSRRYKEPAAMPDLGAFNARIGEMLEDLPTIDGERGLMLPLLELDPIAKAHWVTVYNSFLKLCVQRVLEPFLDQQLDDVTNEGAKHCKQARSSQSCPDNFCGRHEGRSMVGKNPIGVMANPMT